MLKSDFMRHVVLFQRRGIFNLFDSLDLVFFFQTYLDLREGLVSVSLKSNNSNYNYIKIKITTFQYSKSFRS